MQKEAYVEVTVLGPVGLWHDGAAIDLGTRLQRLLAALVVAEGSVVSVDSLLEIVWSGDPPRRPDSTLRSYVTRLRHALDADQNLIQHRKPGYTLDLDHDRLDASLFVDELDRAVAHLRTGDATTAADLLRGALSRWRGPALAGMADEEWARPTAVRLEERRLEASEALIEAHLSNGAADVAIASARSLAAEQPLRERPRELLMRALYQSGRQAEALREFTAFRRYLTQETGLDPSAELSDLEGRIVRGESRSTSTTRSLGSYELGERVGEGAYAVVHRAVQPGLDRDVAIKIIRAELANSTEFVRRFEVEARTIARIEHPNVVPLYDFWREPGAAYLVMRLLRGGTVQEALRARGPFSRERTAEVLADVGGALEMAHRRGVVHRDVRPGNLLLDEGGTAYLSDFGIALPTLAVDDLPIAAPAYAAPEVLRGEPAGVSADVLSLGVTAFEMLTGRLPFADSADRAELVRRQMTDPLPSVRSTRTDLPATVDEILARGTSKAADDRHASVAEFVAELQRALVRTQPSRRTPSVGRGDAHPASNPYVGLHAFEEQDADRFHGREALVTELVEAMDDHRLVVVVGPSGSGKSSVARAGLLPAIRRGALHGSDGWFVTTMVPGSNPVDALEAALLRVAVNPPASLHQQLREEGGLLRAVRRVLPNDHAQVLVVIDQFEELFTQAADAEERERFLTELAAAITSPRSPLRVVATLRADHYDAPLRHREMAQLVSDGTVTVRPMSPRELERAIVGPQAGLDIDIEPALVAELVAGIDERPTALPLLQFSLTELFERRTDNVMLLATHLELGGLSAAVAKRADRIVDAGGSVDEAATRRIFGRLVSIDDSGDDTRRRALRSEFGDDERTAWLLDAFVTARLLSTHRDEATRAPSVEVAHESLLREWPRLRQWLDEDRADLRMLHVVAAAADGWVAADRDAGELARGGRLLTARELATRRPEWLSERETAWLTASISAADLAETERQERADRDRRQNGRLRALLVAAAFFLVAALGAATIALALRSRADDERAGAENAREDAEIERLSAQSAAEIATEPDRAILLALEAHRRRDDVDTQTALHRSIAEEQRLVSVHPDPFGTVTLSAISDDGTTGLTASAAEGAVVWFDGSSGQLYDSKYQAASAISDVAISGDGTVTALALQTGDIVFVDTDGNEIGELRDEGGLPLVEPSLDADGDTVAVALGQTEQVLIADVATREPRVTVALDADLAGANHVDLSPAADLLAVGANPGGGPVGPATLNLFDVETGELRERWDTSRGLISTIALSADTFASGYDDGTVEIRSLEDRSVVSISAHAGFVEHVAIAGDGRVLSAGGGEMRIWSADGQPLALPLGLSTQVESMAASADGRVSIARQSSGLLVIDESGGPLIDAAHPVVVGGQLSPNHPYYDAPGPDFRSLRIVDLASGDLVRELDLTDVHTTPIGPPFYSPDGDFVLTYEQRPDSTMAVTEISGDRQFVFAAGEIYRTLLGESPGFGSFTGLRPESGGERIFGLARNGEGTVRSGWFDLETMELVSGPIDLGFAGRAFLLADGRVAHGGFEAGNPIGILPAELAGPEVVVEGTDGLEPFHEDVHTGRILVGGPGDIAGVVDPDTAEFSPIEGVRGTVYAAAFSPDGSALAVASYEEGVQLFDATTLEPVGIPVDLGVVDQNFARGMRWSEDGTGVWVSPSRGPIRIAADPDRWVEIACAIVQRELSAEEWASFVDPDSDPVAACDRS